MCLVEPATRESGFDLLRTLPVDDHVVFSPASIGHAVTMASAAGDDAMRSAIESALGLPEDAHEAWNHIDRVISASRSDKVTVTIADRIWPDFVERLDQDLLDEIDSTFTTGPYELLLPKWDDEYEIDLLEWLTDIGAASAATSGQGRAISGNADASGCPAA